VLDPGIIGTDFIDHFEQIGALRIGDLDHGKSRIYIDEADVGLVGM
jgi:hypothetical protein